MAYHCLTKYKDGGTCHSLTGQIFWHFVYVEDPKSRWHKKERDIQEKVNQDVIRYLKKGRGAMYPLTLRAFEYYKENRSR